MTTNLFTIANPERCICRVMDYRFNDSSMVIRIQQPTFDRHFTSFYALFQGVQYFEGPMGWTGAGFETRSAEDCLALFRQTGRYADFADDVLKKMFRLYVAMNYASNGQNGVIRMIASSALLTQEAKGTFTDKLSEMKDSR